MLTITTFTFLAVCIFGVCSRFECRGGRCDLVEVGNMIAAVEIIVNVNLKLKVERGHLDSSGWKMA